MILPGGRRVSPAILRQASACARFASMGWKLYFPGSALLDLETIGAAAVEAALQLFLIGEQFDRPESQSDQADEEHPGDEIDPVSMPVLAIRLVISLHASVVPSRTALARRRLRVYRGINGFVVAPRRGRADNKKPGRKP